MIFGFFQTKKGETPHIVLFYFFIPKIPTNMIPIAKCLLTFSLDFDYANLINMNFHLLCWLSLLNLVRTFYFGFSN